MDLSLIISELEAYEKAKFDLEGYLLEFNVKPDRTVELNGNSAGLISYARQILELVQKDLYRNHLHFDPNSGFASGSDELIINYEKNNQCL
jgi:hypothetical protein